MPDARRRPQLGAASIDQPFAGPTRVAVVELNPYHDEILPTVVYALNRLGIRPDVYVRGATTRKDPFAFASGLRFRRRSIDGRGTLGRWTARLRGTPARYGRYQLVILNSTEPPAVVEAASRIGRPTIGIVHNGNLIHGDPGHRDFFAAPRRTPMVLAPHIAATLAADPEPPLWLAPFYLGDGVLERPSGDGPTRLCVQGNIEPVRRDYEALLDATQEVAAERSDFVVHMVGRSSSAYGRAFRAEVDARDLADRFAFNQGEVSHRAYRAQVAGADFLLPLVHAGVPRLRPYFEVKLTSSMSMAIALGVIPIVERDLASLYGAADGAVTYDPGNLARSMRTALELRAAERAAKVDALARLRSTGLAESVRNLAASIARVGAVRG